MCACGSRYCSSCNPEWRHRVQGIRNVVRDWSWEKREQRHTYAEKDVFATVALHTGMTRAQVKEDFFAVQYGIGGLPAKEIITDDAITWDPSQSTKPITINGFDFIIKSMEIEARSGQPSQYNMTLHMVGPTEGKKVANTKRELELAREAMLRQMAETEAALQKYAKFPEDGFADGTLLRFSREHEVRKNIARGITLEHAAVRGKYGYALDNMNQIIAFDASTGKVETEQITLTYAAIKVGGDEDPKWYVTGSEIRKAITWEELTEYLLEWKVKELQFFGTGDADKTVGL